MDKKRWFDRRVTPKLILITLMLVVFMFALARSIPTKGPGGSWSTFDDPDTTGAVVLHSFEITCLAFMLISILHACMNWGWRRALFFFTFGLIYGFLLEEITVTFSEYYLYNPNAWLTVSNTMMAVPFCWTAIIYTLVVTIENNGTLRGLSTIDKGLLAGVLAVSIDVSLDAVFVAWDLWHWKEWQWFGVPLANYAAWFCAVGGFTAIWTDVSALRKPQIVKELGLALGMAMSYMILLFFVLAVYLISGVVF